MLYKNATFFVFLGTTIIQNFCFCTSGCWSLLLAVPCSRSTSGILRHTGAVGRESLSSPYSSSTILFSSSPSDDRNYNTDDNYDDDDDDDDFIAPGKMRVSEIKAELELRNVSYQDCFDKESFIQRLTEARATGRADPSILQQFNRQKLESIFRSSSDDGGSGSTSASASASSDKNTSIQKDLDIRDADIQAAVANDGTLPGGLTPDQFKKLTSNADVMTMLQSTKIQEAMQLVMTGGSEELENRLRDDPELEETLAKLNSILSSLQ